jgi:hypothetical protein
VSAGEGHWSHPVNNNGEPHELPESGRIVSGGIDCAHGLKLVIAGNGTVGVSGDLAYEAGTFSVVDGSGKAVDTGKYLGVFLKKDGKWRYIRDTWNSDHAPAAASAAAPDAAVKAPTG